MPFIQATGFGAVGFGVRCDKENEQDKCGQHVVGGYKFAMQGVWLLGSPVRGSVRHRVRVGFKGVSVRCGFSTRFSLSVSG